MLSEVGAWDQLHIEGVSNIFFKSNLDLRDYRDLDFARPAAWSHFLLLFVCIFYVPHQLENAAMLFCCKAP